MTYKISLRVYTRVVHPQNVYTAYVFDDFSLKNLYNKFEPKVQHFRPSFPSLFIIFYYYYNKIYILYRQIQGKRDMDSEHSKSGSTDRIFNFSKSLIFVFILQIRPYCTLVHYFFVNQNLELFQNKIFIFLKKF